MEITHLEGFSGSKHLLRLYDDKHIIYACANNLGTFFGLTGSVDESID